MPKTKTKKVSVKKKGTVKVGVNHKKVEKLCKNALCKFHLVPTLIDSRGSYCKPECGYDARREKEKQDIRHRLTVLGGTAHTTATVGELKEAVRIAQREVREQETDARKMVVGSKFIATTLERARLSKPPKWGRTKRAGGTLPKKHNYAVAMLSDTHFDERVFPEQVQGMNCYGRAIGDLRLRQFFTNVIELADDWLTGISYDGLLLPLGGDIFTGYIHDELRQTNDAPIFDSLFHYGDQMIAGINMVADYFGVVKIPAVVGNHGRLDKKPRSKHKVQDSYDWALYQYIKHHFKTVGDKRVEFMISHAADQQFSVYSTSFCLTHGDQFRGGGGISGIMTPLMIGDHRKRRRLARLGQSYEWLIMGHWHQLIFGNGIIVNGSLIGFNEYAFNANLDFDKPRQAFFLVDPEHGITINAPIHVVSEAEKWTMSNGAPWVS